MAARIFFNKKRGNALGEYALILGIVTIALVSMNVYMKRGIQGKVKDMTDYFIAPQSEHDENTDDEVFTTSSSDVVTQHSSTSIRRQGGGTAFITSEGSNIQAGSESIITRE